LLESFPFVVFESANNTKIRLLQSEREASTSRKQIDRCRLSHAGQILGTLSIDVQQCQTRALFRGVGPRLMVICKHVSLFESDEIDNEIVYGVWVATRDRFQVASELISRCLTGSRTRTDECSLVTILIVHLSATKLLVERLS